MKYASNITLPELANRILAADRIMVTTHTKPDGDAIGSTLALTRGLSAKSKQVDMYLAGPVAPNLLKIAGRTPFRLLENQLPGDDYDLGMVIDTGAWAQLEAITPWLKKHHERVVCIDHHTRGDDIASARLVDSSAVSASAMLIPLFDEMRCEITGGIGGVAEALFVGLATDSGWFRYGNAGVEAFQLAARLLEHGVNKDRLYQILEETFGPQRLALEARALASLEYARQGVVAIQSLRMNDFEETGASSDDVTGLVNTPMTIGEVRVSVLLTQNEPGKTKLSFRSKPPLPDAEAHEFIDVNVLASHFGGGGHVHAAGARMNKNIEDAKAAVITAVGHL